MIIINENPNVKVDKSTAILKIKLNHTWLPDEFADLIESVTFLYNYIFINNVIDLVYKNGFPYPVLPSNIIDREDTKTINDLFALFSHNLVSDNREIDWKVYTEIGKRLEFPYQLDVTKIDYINSSIDFFGVGEAFESIKDLISEMMKLSFEKRKYNDSKWLRMVQLQKEVIELDDLISKADIEKRRSVLESNILMQDLIAKQLENLEKMLDLTKKAGISKKQTKKIEKKIINSITTLMCYYELDKIKDIVIINENNNY